MNISQDLLETFNLSCKSDATVLITGATGTGKTSLAREIHNQSSRKEKPFVSVNLACLHEGTLESELFGHEKGAFTGAEKRRIGKLESAQGGTVFLDEIGELPPRLQARLLDFLQFQIISPVGSNQNVRLDVRIIAATHRDLLKAVQKNEFREDLFHRLRVISMEMKSLKDRSEDFDRIFHACLQGVCTKSGKSIERLSPAVAELFESYLWPGNFRELQNILEYAVLSSQGPELKLSDLPSWFVQARKEGPLTTEVLAPVLGFAEIPLSLDFKKTWAFFEKEYLQRALERHRGSINRTARQIGMSKTTLIRRIRAYGIRL